jgi:hypothetical protein
MPASLTPFLCPPAPFVRRARSEERQMLPVRRRAEASAHGQWSVTLLALDTQHRKACHRRRGGAAGRFCCPLTGLIEAADPNLSGLPSRSPALPSGAALLVLVTTRSREGYRREDAGPRVLGPNTLQCRLRPLTLPPPNPTLRVSPRPPRAFHRGGSWRARVRSAISARQARSWRV